jgi:hypothetical protein
MCNIRLMDAASKPRKLHFRLSKRLPLPAQGILEATSSV